VNPLKPLFPFSLPDRKFPPKGLTIYKNNNYYIAIE
jgi:hypothetical protein